MNKNKKHTHIPSANENFEIQKRFCRKSRTSRGGIQRRMRVVQQLCKLLPNRGSREQETHGNWRFAVMNAQEFVVSPALLDLDKVVEWDVGSLAQLLQVPRDYVLVEVNL